MNRRIVALIVLILFGACRGPSPKPAKPQLVVVVVVDGLSERQLADFQPHYGPGGLRRFFEQGAHFSQAFHGHATTFTATSHATVLTGADPSVHGIVSNDWVNRDGFSRVYGVADPDASPLGETGRGVSPKNLLAQTLGDALMARSADSRILAIAIKDRTAVLTAGRSGAAWYLSTDSGRFITSTYYRSVYPGWWNEFFASRPQDAWFGRQWEPLRELPSGLDIAPTGRDLHRPEGGMGKAFPHPLGSGQENPARPYYRELARSPFGHDYTVQFVEAALAAESPGHTPGRTDLLVVGFSSHDYVNHNYGPESPESADAVLRLDAALARLFLVLEERIGLDRIVFALTADHGFPASPEFRVERGLSGGRLDMPRILTELKQMLGQRYATLPEAVQWLAPGVFLDAAAWRERGFSAREIEGVAAAFLRAQEGVLAVFTRSQLESEQPATSPLEAAVRRSWHPQRSGDLIVIQQEGWYLQQDPFQNASMHGSPHDYDRHVPLLFLGPGIRPGEYGDRVETIDLVPTLAWILDVDPPETATGRVLAEALE